MTRDETVCVRENGTEENSITASLQWYWRLFWISNPYLLTMKPKEETFWSWIFTIRLSRNSHVWIIYSEKRIERKRVIKFLDLTFSRAVFIGNQEWKITEKKLKWFWKAALFGNPRESISYLKHPSLCWDLGPRTSYKSTHADENFLSKEIKLSLLNVICNFPNLIYLGQSTS